MKVHKTDVPWHQLTSVRYFCPDLSVASALLRLNSGIIIFCEALSPMQFWFPSNNALHLEALSCIQNLWISNRFSEVIESYVWGEQGTNFIAGKFERRCFKVDGFCNADKGKEAGCLLKLWGVSDRIVWLNNTCQHSARVETKDMSSSRSWQC